MRGVEVLKITITYLLPHHFLESDKLIEGKDHSEVSYQLVPLKFRKWWKVNAEIQRYAQLLLKTTPSMKSFIFRRRIQNLNQDICLLLLHVHESLLVHLGLLWSSRCSIVIDGWRNWSWSFRRLRHLFALPARAALDPGEFGALVWGLLTDLLLEHQDERMKTTARDGPAAWGSLKVQMKNGRKPTSCSILP